MSKLVITLVAGLSLVGCKKKEPAAAVGSGSSGSSNGGTATGSGSAGSAVVPTAAGGAVGNLPVVTECPKSLAGSEKVARTIKKECGPIAVTGELTIEGSLTLEAGVILKFAPDAQLTVGYNNTAAKLIVKGGDAPDQRVLFTSGGDKAAGVWKGVHLYDGADRSQITGLDVEYAGTADGAAVELRGAIDVTFTKSTIKHARNLGLEAHQTSTFAAFGNITFDDIGKIPLAVEPVTVGTLGAGNTFPKDSYIEIRGGHLPSDATWKNVGAPYHIVEEVDVQTETTPTKLTLADVTMVFASGVELAVGYNSKGTLVVTGPATFTSVDGKPGTWKGIHVYGTGEATIDNATFSSGGDDSSGALNAKSGAKLTLGTVTFKDNKNGLWFEDNVSLTAPKPLTFSGNERAAHVFAGSFGGMSGANVYADGQVIEIAGGKLTADTTWTTQPKAAVHVIDEVSVESGHTLTIGAGGTYAWRSGVELAAGYNSPGTLVVSGTAAAPVTFGVVTTGEQWHGIKLYDQARGVSVNYANLSDVAGDAGVWAKAGSIGKLDHVTCAHCAATFGYECGAKVDPTAVTTGADTKVAVKKPDGC